MNSVSWLAELLWHVSHTDTLADRARGTRGDLADLVASLVNDRHAMSRDTRAFDLEANSPQVLGRVLDETLLYLLCFGQSFLADVRNGDVLLSDDPHQASLDWSDVSGHLVSVEAQACLQSQRVSGSEASRHQILVLAEEILSQLDGVLVLDADFETVLAFDLMKCTSVATSAEYGLDVEVLQLGLEDGHEWNFAEILLDQRLDHTGSFWSLDSHQSSVSKELKGDVLALELLFEDSFEVLHVDLHIASVKHSVAV